MNWVFVDFWFSTLAWSPTRKDVYHHLCVEDGSLDVGTGLPSSLACQRAAHHINWKVKSTDQQFTWAKEESQLPFAYIMAASCIYEDLGTVS